MQVHVKKLFLLTAALVAVFFVMSCTRFMARAEPRAPAYGCNPLGGGAGEDCLLPFPSSYYLADDSRTITGKRVRLPGAILPESNWGAALDPAPYNERDGFSSASTL